MNRFVLIKSGSAVRCALVTSQSANEMHTYAIYSANHAVPITLYDFVALGGSSGSVPGTALSACVEGQEL